MEADVLHLKVRCTTQTALSEAVAEVAARAASINEAWHIHMATPGVNACSEVSLVALCTDVAAAYAAESFASATLNARLAKIVAELTAMGKVIIYAHTHSHLTQEHSYTFMERPFFFL